MDANVSEPSISRVRNSVSAFTDELEGELEKISIFGVHMTRKVVLSILGLFAFLSIMIGVSVGGGSSDGIDKSVFGKEHRYYSLGNVIESSVGKVVYDNSTNRHNALLWLANEDPMRLDSSAPLDEILERFVLAYFYFATNGHEWTDQFHFFSKKSVCHWNDKTSGVFCNDNNRVSRILMPDSHLTGSIPHDIGLLSNMKRFNLTRNEIDGTIPVSVGIMSSLTTFDFSMNYFSGPIPKSIAMLLDLVFLDLSDNKLEGNDDINVIKDLPNLEELHLNRNKLKGNVGQFGESDSLRVIDLSYNSIGGTLSHKISGGKNLKILKLNDNYIAGDIQKSFGKFSNLVELDLSENKLTGSLPSTLGDLTALESLKLTTNEIQGGLPSELGNLKELIVLEIGDNGIESIPSELFNMANLQRLSLSFNRILGSLPTEIGLATSLVELDLANNQITDKLPPELSNLSDLEYLYLNNNLFDGSIPSDLSNLYLLREMNLSNNNFFGDMESQFCGARLDGGNPIENFVADCLTGDIIFPCATECCDNDKCCHIDQTDCN